MRNEMPQRCPMSISGVCLLLTEGFFPGCMTDECELQPDEDTDYCPPVEHEDRHD